MLAILSCQISQFTGQDLWFDSLALQFLIAKDEKKNIPVNKYTFRSLSLAHSRAYLDQQMTTSNLTSFILET